VQWQYTPYIWPLILSAFLAWSAAVLIWRRRPAVGATPLAALGFILGLWAALYAVEITSVGLEAKLFWAKLQYFCIPFAAPLFMTFARRYSTGGRSPSPRHMFFFYLIPALTILVVWTDQWHGLFYRNIALDMSGAFSAMAKTYGPWFWFFYLYNSLLMLLGSLALLRMALTTFRTYRGQAISMLAVGLLPWMGNLAYVVGQSHGLRLDLTPVALSLSAILTYWALFRHGLFDIVPAARDAIVESLADAVMVMDSQKRLVYLNPAASRLIGDERDALIGRNVREVLTPWPEVLERYRDVSEAQDELVFAQNGRRSFDVSIAPLRDGRGRLIGRMVTLHETTERKLLEEQLRQSQKMEAIGILAGGIAHHFNNLLTVINGYSEMALKTLPEDAPARRDVETILKAGRQAAELTRQLLVFSRRERPHMEVVDLNQVLRGMDKMLPLFLEEGIALELRLSEEPLWVKADPRQIEQIIANLLTNARDAIQETHADGHVTITTTKLHACSLAQGKPCARLSVQDTGVGISPEVREHLFEPFFTTKEVGRGTGLGLATTYGIVRELGGVIEVQSAPGEGATFHVDLPITASPSALVET
jgi:PAS domain S-box-containing protein